jgi:hypothetical protein
VLNCFGEHGSSILRTSFSSQPSIRANSVFLILDSFIAMQSAALAAVGAGSVISGSPGCGRHGNVQSVGNPPGDHLVEAVGGLNQCKVAGY